MHARLHALLFCLFAPLAGALAAPAERVVEIPTRPGVTEKFVYVAPDSPKAAAILFTGGNGLLGIFPNGSMKAEGNFLVRSRRLFAEAGIAVAAVDVPSDRNAPPYLAGFRQTPDHAADIRAVIAWLRQQSHVPVWLIGTSRGTQSAAWIATQLPADAGGPDGIVLTSSILVDPKSRAVPMMDLDKLKVPVLVVHHEQDGCKLCPPADLPRLMERLTAAPRKELVTFAGGSNTGDPCEPWAHHGFNGIEAAVVTRVAQWMLAP